jgi:2-phospho-L-lactate/phosphoenolpyruvate guanylyltransferase
VVGTPATPSSANPAVLVPVKAFTQAKQRLRDVLDPERRRVLVESMAAGVLAAAGDLPCAVVCDDTDVRDWATAHDADTIWTPGLGLNGALMEAVRRMGRRGFTRIIVAHADLPLATDLGWLAAGDGVTLVPDRHRDGTNVVCVPAAAGFQFAYGAGSFAAHRREAARLELTTRIVNDDRLGWDVDVADDLQIPAELGPPAYLTDPVPCR